ncbi:hypothetical protein ANTQUA_LOCUS9336 [Anthophora quadrimaculata]
MKDVQPVCSEALSSVTSTLCQSDPTSRGETFRYDRKDDVVASERGELTRLTRGSRLDPSMDAVMETLASLGR